MCCGRLREGAVTTCHVCRCVPVYIKPDSGRGGGCLCRFVAVKWLEINRSMAAPHQNGVNNVHGADKLPLVLLPSTSGDAFDEAEVPHMRDLCFRGLLVCRDLVYRLARRFGSQGLVMRTLEAVYQALSLAERTIVWANAAAYEPQSAKWYMMIPIKAYLVVTKTGADLVEKYLDIRLPENEDLASGLHDLRITLLEMQEDISNMAGPDVELPDYEPSSVGPALSSSSSLSSLSDQEKHSSDEEPAQPGTPGDKSMYFSVEQLTENVEGLKVDVEDDKREKAEEKSEEKSEETAQEGKVEEEQPLTATEETVAAAKSTEQPQPEPSQPQTSPPADCPVSAEEAERAAMGALPKPSAQPASSQDLLAAEGSYRAKPDTRKSARGATSKPTKTGLRKLFGS